MALDDLIQEEIPADDPLNTDRFKSLVLRLIAEKPDLDRPIRILGVGEGRTPLLDPDEMRALDVEYWLADVSQTELDQLDSSIFGDVKLLCFDISTPDLRRVGSVPLHHFDLVLSRSLLEHVSDTDQALANCAELLAPGGVMVHFFPTLWNPVFIANKLLPERVSSGVLKKVVNFQHEKFPALYHRTTSGALQERRLRSLGLVDVAVVPFWGHNYLHFLPPVHRLERRFAQLARRRDWRWYTTYCFIGGRRPAAPAPQG
jgi:SAM-dependent methyltransferase